ncbi:M15 family metallopeptidase [Agarivorans sp. QJM3NY_25]|uniref:M15 family metallopeptidase n=1 Tax=Agarivorans sp. QJM3NY_25 TaxID=3421430 RepID=UPI003D7EDB35
MNTSNHQAGLYGLNQQGLVNSADFAWIHPGVLEDLRGLASAATQAGFQLAVYSGYRDFHRQSLIWNHKWQGLRPILDQHSHPISLAELSDEQKMHAILRWSALPGTSRHHWGTDFDLYDPQLLPAGSSLALIPQEYEAGGCQHSFACWLEQHAKSYGFFFPYQRFQGGVEFEPWHLSHLACSQIKLSGLETDTLLSHLRQAQVAGFTTIEQHIEQIFEQYVRNICLPES